MQAHPRAAAPIVFPALLATTLPLASGWAQQQQQTVQAVASQRDRTQQTCDVKGLPTFLLPVPGGKTTIGITSEQLIQAVCEAVNPRRPELAAKDPKTVRKPLVNTLSELGQQKVDVAPFLLGKWPVTNREYEVFVTKMRALGNKTRAPFHWWRFGCKDDYEKRLEEINKLFKAQGKWGPILYWEQHGEDLPYALKDEEGRPIDDQPVVFVSYRDAQRFAGWLGMRLPTEIEWTRAARGDGNNVWPWGNNKEIGDKYDEKVLELLQLDSARNRKLKPVGKVEFATGPYGHVDMTGQVWQYTSGLGFAPINGQKYFEGEWLRLQKDKICQDVQTPPLWHEDHVVVKGGSYLSYGDPIQFHVDSRTNLDTNNPIDSVGFRLAKSPKPGYDLLFSLVHSDYKSDRFAHKQEPDLASQVGLERYVLDQRGFPDEYHAVTFAGVNWVSNDKNAQLKKLEEQSQVQPLVLGTIATTEKLLVPPLEPGIYTLAYRDKGMPKELTAALKTGFKEVQARLKHKGKGGDEPAAEAGGEGDKGDKQGEKQGRWSEVLARFGLAEKDLEPEDALDKLKFVRIDAREVPTETSVFLFFDNQGKLAAQVEANGLANGNLAPNDLQFDGRRAGKEDRAHVGFDISVPQQPGQKRAVTFKLDLMLDQPPPKSDQSWRLPVKGGAASAGSSNQEKSKV